MEKLQHYMLLLVLVFGLSSLSHVQAQTEYLEYGQSCNPKFPGTVPPACFSSDIHDPLTCTDKGFPEGHICLCEAHMFRIQKATFSRCVSPHNMTCTVRSNDGFPIRTCTDFAQCWLRSPDNGTEPRVNGTCLCDSDARADPTTGQCKLTHGSERCGLETDCNVLAGLTCRGGKCACLDEAVQVFDPETETCKSLVGGSCKSDADCLGPSMECNSGTFTCQCSGDGVPNPDKTCGIGLGYGQNCTASSDCLPGFECDLTDKTCGCPAGHQHDNGTCRILAGGNCTATSTSLACTEHAQCLDGVCTCSGPNFGEGRDGRCVGLYGAPCNSTILCSSEDHLVCSQATSTCQCQANYEGDNSTGVCIGLIGQPCRALGQNDLCVGNSICGAGQICRCGTRQVASGDKRSCQGLYGAACLSSSDCVTSRFLSCNSTTQLCDCARSDKQLYERERDSCVARASAECEASANGILCVGNSTCSLLDPRTCKCDPTFVPSEEGKCVAGSSTSVVSSSSALLSFVMISLIGKNY